MITNITDDDVAAHEAAYFADKVKTVKSLPDPWIAAWVVSITKGKFTSVMCDQVHGADTSALVAILCFACMICPTLTLPKDMMSKVFCAKVLDLRYHFCGSRLVNFEKCINADGTINWLLACAFEFRWAGNTAGSRLETIRFKYSNCIVQIPAHYTISVQAYKLEEPWLDWLGMFTDGKASHLKLCDVFSKAKADPQGPWKFPYDKQCKFLADFIRDVKDALATAAAAQQQAGEQVVELTTAAAAVSAKRATTLKRARESLKEADEAQKGIRLRREESLE